MTDRQQVEIDIHETQQYLKELRSYQSELRRNLECMSIPYNQFKVNRNFQDGNAMFNSVARIALDNFDSRSKWLISKLTLNNCSDIMDRIGDIYNQLNHSMEPFNIIITDEYYDLKIKECWYEHKLLLYKSRRKEIEKAEREIIKEQVKEEKQIEKEKAKYEKERMDLQYKYAKLKDENKKQDIQNQISYIDKLIEQDEYRLRHNRCGYVYVVSNDDMSPNQYKIGITRRTVEERMKELGSGASHSFPMNVHGYVYCEDCFQVEATMHRVLADKRVNQLNPKKEWFKTTLEEIATAFRENCGITIDLQPASSEAYEFSRKEIDL